MAVKKRTPGTVMTGARAKVYVNNTLVGIFDSVSYAVNVGAEPNFILGRYSASEITHTSYEAVSVNCTGFRLIGNGGHVLPKVPKVQDLLNLEYVTLAIVDRQGGSEDITNIATIVNCIPVSYSTGYQAKQVSRIQVTYLGTIASDEEGAQDETAGAVSLP